MMPAPDLSQDPASLAVPDHLVEAGVYQSSKEGFDHGLVVLAMGRPFWLVPWADSHRLLVEPQTVAEVREQLARFDRESVGWPPRPISENLPVRDAEFFAPTLWCLAVFAAYRVQGLRPDLERLGLLDTQAVFDRGEWWRPLTALLLHADAGHLLSNALCGVLVFSAVLTTIGRWRGGLLLVLASVAGNLAVAGLNYPGPYYSLGASTAVFAGLGLLTGHAIRAGRENKHPHRWRAVFVPLAAGLTVLGLYGAGGGGGGQVDVGAHLSGFIAGLLLGFMAAWSQGALVH